MRKIEERFKPQLVTNPMHADDNLLNYVSEYDNGEKIKIGDQYLHGIINTGEVKIDDDNVVGTVNLIYLKPEHLDQYELDEIEGCLTVQPIIKRKQPQ